MQFSVRSLSPGNQLETVGVEAVDAAAARSDIASRGHQVLAVEVAKPARAQLQQARHGGRFSLLQFSQELISLLNAGLGLVESVEGLLDKETSAQSRAVLQGLLLSLRHGHRLSDALQAQPGIFPMLFVGLVQAAEGTSDLPRALARYVDYRSRLDALRSRVVSAAIYPAVLLVVGGGVCLFLMTYVVPRFALVYQGSGRDLPWQSQWLLAWGQWLADHPWLALGVTGCAVLLIGMVSFRLRRDGAAAAFWRRLPFIGPNIALLELTRLYLTLGMLLEGGISIMTALDLVGGTLAPSRRAALRQVKAHVGSGQTLSSALAAHGLSTPIALRLLRVGERSGQLGGMLTQAAIFHEAQTSRWIENFARLFEPVLMVVIGLVIGLIVVLLYIPIFDLAGSFG